MSRQVANPVFLPVRRFVKPFVRAFLLAVVVALTVIGGQVTSPANALIYGGVYALGCTSFDRISGLPGSEIQPNRNTAGTVGILGQGDETIQTLITDGAGTILYYNSTLATVGSTYYFFGPLPYYTLPKYNPLTLTIISPAGNGFPDQPVLSLEGSCAGLPTYGATPDPTAPAPATTATPRPYFGPVLPDPATMIQAIRSTPILSAAGGIPVPGAVLAEGQTAFVIATSKDGAYYQIFVMGGWVAAKDTNVVARNFGQK